MTQVISHRAFEPGTTGWTIDDLEDPEILWRWSEGRYELVEGVLTKMTPQGFENIDPLQRLRRMIERHVDAANLDGEFYPEVDVLLNSGRVVRPDALFLTAKQHREQKRISHERGLPQRRYHPVYIAPTLIVESVSIGHEDHDRVTKRRWYAEFGVPHYWLLTEHEHSLICLVLDGKQYKQETGGSELDRLTTTAFPGLTIDLSKLWE